MVISASLRTDSNGQSLGYGYVQFQNKEQAQRCIEACKNTKLKENIIEVDVFQPRSKRAHMTGGNVYFKQIPLLNDDVKQTEEKMKSILAEFGEIQALVVALDKNLSKPYGFANFASTEIA